MILIDLFLGILNSFLIGQYVPSRRRTFNSLAGVVLVGVFVALFVLVFGPSHIDRSEPGIQRLRTLCAQCIGYFVHATGMSAAGIRCVKRLAGVDTGEEAKKVKSAGGDDEADGDDPDEPDDDDYRKA